MATNRKIRVEGKPILGEGTIALTISYGRSALRVTETPFGAVLELEDAFTSGAPGAPAFPAQLVRVALPPYSDVTGLTVKVGRKTPATKRPTLVAPVQEPRAGLPRPGGSPPRRSLLEPRRELERPSFAAEHRAVTLPRLDEYKRVLAEPPTPVRIAGIEHRGPATIVTLEVRPVSQRNDGILELATEIKVSLSYQATTSSRKNGAPVVGSREFRGARTSLEARRIAEVLRADVVNPGWIPDLDGFWPPLHVHQYDYIVITDDRAWNADTIAATGTNVNLAASFERLVAWKRRRGLRARVVTITDIVQGTFGDFKTGARDLQEVLRNFLKWAFSSWGVSWVLLGGDVNVVPVRVVASGCRGHVGVGSEDPPGDDASFWTGTYLKMHVVSPGEWWPGDWPLLLVNPATGEHIPFDASGTSSAALPGWYYTTDDTYQTRSATATQFVRVNGPAAVCNATLQWLYRWNRIPTDLYYASLVSSTYGQPGLHDWDLLDNGIYGQNTDSADPDGVSYAADVGVGRAPVGSTAEADAFVSKVIAYEQLRAPDGSALNLDWLRRLLVVSSSWGGRIGISPTSANPPGDNRYHHAAGAASALIKLGSAFTDLKWRLFSVVTQTDVRVLPYTPDAPTLGRGWYFAKSDSDLSASELVIAFFGIVFRIPIPTAWVVAHGYSDEVAPQSFIFDRTEADGSMADQEVLRKQLAADLPGLDAVRRLYEDEVDLPAADATSPPVDHLTGDRVRDAINLGQHIVSLSGHGSQGGVAGLSSGVAQNATNGFQTFVGWADSCLTNDFHYADAMSEHLLTNAGGGAVGYVGNTRFSWIGLGDDYQRAFFTRLRSVRNLALLNDSRLTMPNGSVYYKWIKFAQNLVGDPEMPVWIGKPAAMKVTHPAKIQKKLQHVLVKVTTPGGAPIADAAVALAMGTWVASARTDATGQADLHVTPPALGSMEVVVTATDRVPYLGSMAVEEAVVCGPALVCKSQILCGPAISCRAAILCGPAVSCRSAILCGPSIGPCPGGIACNFSISGCKASIGHGCPAIDPMPWKDLIDILEIAGAANVKELAARRNSAKVKKVLSKLAPANRKALTLMLQKVRAE